LNSNEQNRTKIFVLGDQLFQGTALNATLVMEEMVKNRGLKQAALAFWRELLKAFQCMKDGKAKPIVASTLGGQH
jgi:hypothetical protein